MNPATLLPWLLGAAWLLPLASFTLIVLFGPAMGRAGRHAGHLASGAIAAACVLSLVALLGVWLPNHPLPRHADAHHEAIGHAASGESDASHQATIAPRYYCGDWYTLGQFGKLKVTIGYYIDALTVVMFAMVTFIASCIHIYSMGYMHEELHAVTDHEVTLAGGRHLERRGRYHRFFQYLSLFSFSMLGVVIAGNMAMVFVFWELVGICSYFLIGFYFERHSASTAANKAFIVNRVGDFGMIIGLMALWSGLGTFAFGDLQDEAGHVVLADDGSVKEPGIFSQLRPPAQDHALRLPDRMVRAAMGGGYRDKQPGDGATHGYWLLVVAGLGVFSGCVGKSAQFPLHVWLPDAMEGPTPVSALVHSATMVAAGVYLAGRVFPMFTPEVLLVIAYVGGITVFIAATIAITATDIKRVLAYSTVSQLGYMMLSIGVGGWLAAMFHLLTHAFFKSLLFLCSGSVIHAVHTNDMTEMGGLRRKMPWTAYTMLVGCLAIIGAGIPLVIGLSGYYSKDAILEQAYSFAQQNPVHSGLFFIAAGCAALTAFYMFRLWYLTFAGEPRNRHRYEHAHESPQVMYYPLVVLSVLAVALGWTLPGTSINVSNLLEAARPAGTLDTVRGGPWLPALTVPGEHLSHASAIRVPVTWIAFAMSLGGVLLATFIYCWRLLDPREIAGQFRGLYRFFLGKWWFDELYDAIAVQPVFFLSRRVSQLDRSVIDGIVHALAAFTRFVARAGDAIIDRRVVDGLINALAYRTWDLGLSLRRVQTGHLRQYVMLIVIGTVALFMLITFVISYATTRG
jgi:NADH-quinone oxidoreductase subunit L